MKLGIITSLLVSVCALSAPAFGAPNKAKTQAPPKSDDDLATAPPAASAPATAPANDDSKAGAAPALAPPDRKATDTADATDATSEETKISGLKLTLQPYVLVAGGLKYDSVIQRAGEEKENRAVTFAVSRFGIVARFGEYLTAETEFMANGGVGLHGTSAYEGQAAMQVRQQVLRLDYRSVRVEAGRIIDEASLDHTSLHVQDTLFQDTATRDPLLYSGFNMGNGLRGTITVIEGLRLGLTFNAGNPVSTTSTLAVGGTFPPFERLYTQPYQAVGQVPNNFPDDTFHAMVLTPSVLLDSRYVDARVAFQGYDIDTNMTKGTNDHVRGFNLRGTARAKLLDNALTPFVSAAYTVNDTLVPTDLGKRADDRYKAVNLGGGVDYNVRRRFKCAHDCADGVGAQYQQVQFQTGDAYVTTFRYVNVGASYWLLPNVAVGARFAYWVQQQTGQGGAKVVEDVGERSVIVGLRGVLR